MHSLVKRIIKTIKRLGPGFITGAADDDPSGIATYSIAGAQYGYKLNWLSLFLIPMMISIQEMSARIGMCSGMGLAGVIKKFHSKKLLYVTIGLLIIANIINLSANLGIMAASLVMIADMPYVFWLMVVTAVSVLLEIFIPYHKYSNFLRLMGLTLLAYCVTAVITRQDWRLVIWHTLVPHIELSGIYLMTMVGFIGTTISPYLFFWQASEEVEEEIERGQIKDFGAKPHIRPRDIRFMRQDTAAGMVFANIVSACVVITTAATLHAAGITDITSPGQIALALKPLAGNWAYLLFTLGIIGIGLQSVPIFAGGIAYTVAETAGLKEGLGKKFSKARGFYAVLAVATVIGALMNIAGINPIRALYHAAIINGVVSIPLIAIIIRLSDEEKVVGKYRTSRINRMIAVITLVLITVSTVLMIGQLVRPYITVFR